jgi:hypothetical protein
MWYHIKRTEDEREKDISNQGKKRETKDVKATPVITRKIKEQSGKN